ncbi:fungal-specific transcription factor domain-containing protein [Mycena sanguinolenta]|nr:fungal-specific transcription factor domain-containing protein [Mycena sanguinolenta]
MSEVSVQNGKRRRLQGSCDSCRKRKVRCDSQEMPGGRCSNCIASYSECIHSRGKPGGEVPSSSSTTGSTETRTAKDHIASILSTTTVYVPSHDLNVNHRILVEVAQYARSLEERLAAMQLSQTTASRPDSPSPSEGSTSATTEKYPQIGELTKGRTTYGSRFYGRSSGVQFTKAAMSHIGQIRGHRSNLIGIRRPEFWDIQPWQKLTIEAPRQIFPPDDLLESLTKIYFEQINPVLTILHFPSFQQSLLNGLHLRSREFGSVVLVVCALASRHSEDPRVFIEGAPEHSCGWKWFQQVRPLRGEFPWGTSLYHLQFIFLSAIYTSGMAIPEESWILVGHGVRIAQCAGAHHRGGYHKMEPLTAELYRRVFWLLVVADTIMSSFNGRPSITKPNELDVELPLSCDEEYWGMPNAVQPEGKSSTGAYMPVYLQLMLIFGRIQRAVETRIPEEIVELDSQLNKWLDTIPEHLKWDPHQQNQIFLDQSAALYSTYYHAQILIHRPFIPAPGGEEELPNMTHFPSLAICANAARSCGHVLDVQARRGRGLLHQPSLMTALFDSAVVLLINVWAVVGSRKSRTPDDFNKATADAQNCVRVLRLYERRWRTAGRDCDIISAMLNIGKQSLKRPREVEEITASSNVPDASRNLPKGLTTPDSLAQQMQALNSPIPETDYLLSLPLLTEELGRLPIYNSFGYQPTFQLNELPYPAQSYPDPLIEPEQVLLDSTFPIEQDPSGGEDISFNIPVGDNWQDWSVYLAGLDGLNQRSFSEN